MGVKHFCPSSGEEQLMFMVPNDGLCVGHRKLFSKRKIINPVLGSSFVVRLILAGGQLKTVEEQSEYVSLCAFYGSFPGLCVCICVCAAVNY